MTLWLNQVERWFGLLALTTIRPQQSPFGLARQVRCAVSSREPRRPVGRIFLRNPA
jgi:hypothetical protein